MTDTEFPKIHLAGKDWQVKPLVLKQLRVVQPLVIRLRTVSPETITSEQIDDLIEIVYQAVCPAQDKLTRDAFTDLPVTLLEMIAALPTIMKQSGMVRKDGAPGESPSPTGTGSPPMSANAPDGPGITSTTP